MAGIEALLSAYTNPYYGMGSVGSTSSSGLDIASLQKNAQQQAAELLSTYNSNRESVKTLKADTAKYLDDYILSMKTLDQSAEKLRLGNLDKLLYNSDGEVTEDTIADTVKAMQSMVDNYNSTVKLLNDNAERGPGTMKQLARMVADPAPAASMKMVGVTVNKDGTLALDAEKMTEALSTSDANQLALYKDIIGGFGGIADGAHKNASFAANAPARELIQNDLATIQQTQSENPFREMYESFKGNVYAMNNQAVAGMLMNLLV
ncbi:hypothetical protein LJC04_04345 [Ruminococcaceae bacterium OttesenSCG-928-O06]|nr:hypothetical protein [Ruminococcaceae bacterium OttesenSCG-928-O06]